jgi:PAS domain-containing protein
MSQDTWPNGSSAELADLAGRRDALRQAAELPGADPRALLDAAFAELDAAVEVLTKLILDDAGEPDPEAPPPAALSAERNLLRAVFQQAPVPLFLLEPDGTIRRANDRAGDLIGASPGYATGKPLTAFVDLPSRAAVQSQLAAATRTGAVRQADCTLLGPDGPVAATLTASVLEGGARLLVVTAGAAVPPEGGQGGQGGLGGRVSPQERGV